MKDKQCRVKYGITLEEYELRKVAQDGHCYICGRTDASLKHGLNLDHNHATGKVRKFLCPWCNMLVGMVEGDSEGTLPLVFQYIQDCFDGTLT